MEVCIYLHCAASTRWNIQPTEPLSDSSVGTVFANRTILLCQEHHKLFCLSDRGSNIYYNSAQGSVAERPRSAFFDSIFWRTPCFTFIAEARESWRLRDKSRRRFGTMTNRHPVVTRMRIGFQDSHVGQKYWRKFTLSPIVPCCPFPQL